MFILVIFVSLFCLLTRNISKIRANIRIITNKTFPLIIEKTGFKELALEKRKKAKQNNEIIRSNYC